MILVTGSEGYIGTILCKRLKEAQVDFIGIDNFSNSHLATTGNFSENICVCNYDGVRDVFENNKIETVIHLAAKKYVEESFKDPECYYQNNILGTVNLVELSKEFNVNRFIFTSTENINEGKGNPYINSKKYCERIIENAGLNSFLIARLPNVIGGYKIKFGDRPDQNRYFNIFPLINEIIHGRKPALDIKTNNVSTHIDINVVVDSIVDNLNNIFVNKLTFNNSCSCTLEILCYAIETVTGRTIPFAQPRKEYDRNNEYFKNVLSHLEDSIKSSFEYYDYAEKWYL